MEVTLKFNDEEMEEAMVAMKAQKYKDCIDEIWERCFRPNHKHGYGNELLDASEASGVIDKLAKIYNYTCEEMLNE